MSRDPLELRPTLSGDRRETHASDDLYERIVLAACLRANEYAVSHGAIALTYAELIERADQLCREFTALGIPSNSAVALQLPRGIDYVVSVLAVLAHGCHFVPVAENEPATRLDQIIRGVGAVARITTGRGSQPTLTALEPVGCNRDAQPRLAYIMHTSGSTGTPKGACVPITALSSLLAWYGDELAVSEKSRFAHVSRPSFDFSIPEIFVPLLHGGQLIIPVQPIASNLIGVTEYLIEHAVTTIQLVPTLLRPFINLVTAIPSLAARLSSLEAIVCNGESLPDQLRQDVARALPTITLVNSYGPTEACVAVTWHRCSPEQRPLPNVVGRPAPDVDLYVLSEDKLPVPAGTIGELYIGGVQVADGYIGNPVETERAFLELGPGRLYRTGDLVRVLNDGNLEFIGRADRQVQLRGIRVEIGEIEAAVKASASCHEVRVVARRGPGDGSADHLVCFVTPATIDLTELERNLVARLPKDLWPHRFEALASLPATANGKVNEAALLDLARRLDPEVGPAQSATGADSAERVLREAVASVVGRMPTVDESLSDLAIDSLARVELEVAVADRGYQLPPEQQLAVGELAGRMTRIGTRSAATPTGAELEQRFRDGLRQVFDRAAADGHQLVVVQSSLPDFRGLPVQQAVSVLLAEIDRAAQRVTVALPAYTLSFAGSARVDLTRDPSESGLAASHVLKALGAGRTRHPLYSFAILGPRAAELTEPDWAQRSVFGADSIFARFAELDATYLLLATRALAHVHRCEYLAEVGYQSFQDVTGIRTDHHGSGPVTASAYARDLPGTCDSQLFGADLDAIFELGRSAIRSADFGVCEAAVIDIASYERTVVPALAREPYALLKPALRAEAAALVRDRRESVLHSLTASRIREDSSTAMENKDTLVFDEAPYTVVDACVGATMQGNPAAIMRMEQYLSSTALLQLAQEVDEPVTAFVAPRADAHSYDIRWFTRNSELRMCGHATLAASEWLLIQVDEGVPVQWHSRAGVLTARRSDGRVTVEFPETKLAQMDAATTEQVTTVLGIRPNECFVAGDDYLAVLDSAEEVVSHVPSAAAIEQLDCRGVIVTAPVDDSQQDHQDRYDFVSRFFAPRIALPEDEVCVSAHCALYPYWSSQYDRRSLAAWQASPRGGVLELDSPRPGRVSVTGQCRITANRTWVVREDSD